jgi:guanylate kinase
MKNIVIISGAAGSGKDSVIDGLQALMPLERIITTTSRLPRPTESEGHPYYFISKEDFERGIQAGEFVEYSTNENGGLYGVTKRELDRVSHTSNIAIWRVDWKGVVTIKNSAHPNGFTLDEPYIKLPKQDDFTTTLDSGNYFVMGDNRFGSADSRLWGSLPSSDIIGRPVVRLFPLTHVGTMPGDETAQLKASEK